MSTRQRRRKSSTGRKSTGGSTSSHKTSSSGQHEKNEDAYEILPNGDKIPPKSQIARDTLPWFTWETFNVEMELLESYCSHAFFDPQNLYLVKFGLFWYPSHLIQTWVEKRPKHQFVFLAVHQLHTVTDASKFLHLFSSEGKLAFYINLVVSPKSRKSLMERIEKWNRARLLLYGLGVDHLDNFARPRSYYDNRVVPDDLDPDADSFMYDSEEEDIEQTNSDRKLYTPGEYGMRLVHENGFHNSCSEISQLRSKDVEDSFNSMRLNKLNLHYGRLEDDVGPAAEKKLDRAAKLLESASSSRMDSFRQAEKLYLAVAEENPISGGWGLAELYSKWSTVLFTKSKRSSELPRLMERTNEQISRMTSRLSNSPMWAIVVDFVQLQMKITSDEIAKTRYQQIIERATLYLYNYSFGKEESGLMSFHESKAHVAMDVLKILGKQTNGKENCEKFHRAHLEYLKIMGSQERIEMSSYFESEGAKYRSSGSKILRKIRSVQPEDEDKKEKEESEGTVQTEESAVPEPPEEGKEDEIINPVLTDIEIDKASTSPISGKKRLRDEPSVESNVPVPEMSPRKKRRLNPEFSSVDGVVSSPDDVLMKDVVSPTKDQQTQTPLSSLPLPSLPLADDISDTSGEFSPWVNRKRPREAAYGFDWPNKRRRLENSRISDEKDAEEDEEADMVDEQFDNTRQELMRYKNMFNHAEASRRMLERQNWKLKSTHKAQGEELVRLRATCERLEDECQSLQQQQRESQTQPPPG